MTKFHFKSIVIFAAISLAGTSIAYAQHDHGSQGHSQNEPSAVKEMESPHGGMMESAGKYQIELVVNMMQKEDKVTIYLLNKNGKPLSTKDVSGTVMFMYEDGTDVTETLVSKGDNRFVAQLKSMDPFSAMVSLEVKGKTVGANFRHEGMHGHGDSGIYNCPMHPEVTSSKPGNCSKCGMALRKA